MCMPAAATDPCADAGDEDLAVNVDAVLGATIEGIANHVVSTFQLVECGAPFLMLRPSSGESGGQGELRLWQPVAAGGPLEKLVLLRYSSGDWTRLWMAAFAAGDSLVPHLLLGIGHVQTAAADEPPALHLDLLSKVSLAASTPAYLDAAYVPLSACHNDVLGRMHPDARTAAEEKTAQAAAAFSPWMLCVPADAPHAASLAGSALKGYVSHWLGLQMRLGGARLSEEAGS